MGYGIVKKRGFTLIELLVVIAIIAVLMGILMPVLGRARKQTWAVVCRSNLRQLGAAASLYAEDNEQSVPRGAASITEDPEAIWFLSFLPYLGQDKRKEDYRDVRIFRCPAYPDKRQTVCFSINGCYLEDKEDRVGREWLSSFGKCILTKYRRLMDTVYLADNSYLDGRREIIEDSSDEGLAFCDVRTSADLPYLKNQDGAVGVLNPQRRVSASRHRDGVNVLMMDWSVKWTKSKEVDIDLFRHKTR